MPYRIVITSRAQKEFKHLSKNDSHRIKQKILLLAIHPRPTQAKKLKGDTIGALRLRVGDYRVMYDIYESDQTILILHIGHTRNVYRK